MNTGSGTRTARFRRSATLPAQRVRAECVPAANVAAPNITAPNLTAPNLTAPKISAADAPEPDVVVVLAWRPVASLVTGGHPRGAYPVLEADGTVVGVLDLADLARRPELHDRLAAQVCVPATPAHPLVQQLVLDNGRLVGVRGLRSA